MSMRTIGAVLLVVIVSTLTALDVSDVTGARGVVPLDATFTSFAVALPGGISLEWRSAILLDPERCLVMLQRNITVDPQR
ncbi:hypothetical protein [Halomonas sp. 11-S5]|uniref:hypothetical protein n=1 Tax=Halomonas sp. 11-S5 TaxID=2994064 RepID=UPI002468FF2F|nr:hypothetical protein [Halomonas sp. 11-S5]